MCESILLYQHTYVYYYYYHYSYHYNYCSNYYYCYYCGYSLFGHHIAAVMEYQYGS